MPSLLSVYHIRLLLIWIGPITPLKSLWIWDVSTGLGIGQQEERTKIWLNSKEYFEHSNDVCKKWLQGEHLCERVKWDWDADPLKLGQDQNWDRISILQLLFHFI